jgi:pimeloyl-ACP methyl ester carboxylesterase
VLFVPGWGCPVYVFRRNLPAIAAAGFRAIAVDLKGHGLSDKPLGEAGYNVDALVDHIADILAALELDNPALVGHSMGATLLYHYLSRTRGNARALGLLSPVGLSGVPLMWLYRLLTPRFVAPLVRRVRPRFVITVTLRRVYGERGHFNEEDVDQYWAQTRFPEYGLAMLDLLHAYDWNAAEHRELEPVAIPAVGLWGSHDHLMPRDGMGAYKRLVPGIALHEIVGAGHIIPEETPQDVNGALIALLQGR